jgi:D-alanyl-lipoteichoic acid acyltransferase DltB (MBOAT superfamily)
VLFHTWTFVVFFSVVYAGYLCLRNTRLKLHWLLAASYFFYGWWNPFYLVLLLYTTCVHYFSVRRMMATERKRFWFVFSLANGIACLGVFKYAGFVTGTANAALAALGIKYQMPVPHLLLPIGISFYTFQALSYAFDCYRGHTEPEPSFLRFAAYVSLFPQLVSGPIARAGDLLPQLRAPSRIAKGDITDGLSLIAVGLFKKVALADYLAMYVGKAYAMPGAVDGFTLLAATFAFGWQVYFDFSGYTDMARGIARLLGLRLMLNFNNPYLATGLGDFWQRWHISLSSWLMHYVFFPLAKYRRGRFSTHRSMFLTMLICGLWHGAAWTFVVWGALHRLGRVVTRDLEHARFYRERVPRICKQVAVFAFVTFTWVFFRAETWSDALLIVRRIFTSAFGDPNFPILALVLIGSIWSYQFLYESRLRQLLEWAPIKVALVVAILTYLTLCPEGGSKPFVYFQF